MSLPGKAPKKGMLTRKNGFKILGALIGILVTVSLVVNEYQEEQEQERQELQMLQELLGQEGQGQDRERQEQKLQEFLGKEGQEPERAENIDEEQECINLLGLYLDLTEDVLSVSSTQDEFWALWDLALAESGISDEQMIFHVVIPCSDVLDENEQLSTRDQMLGDELELLPGGAEQEQEPERAENIDKELECNNLIDLYIELLEDALSVSSTQEEFTISLVVGIHESGFSSFEQLTDDLSDCSFVVSLDKAHKIKMLTDETKLLPEGAEQEQEPERAENIDKEQECNNLVDLYIDLFEAALSVSSTQEEFTTSLVVGMHESGFSLEHFEDNFPDCISLVATPDKALKIITLTDEMKLLP